MKHKWTFEEDFICCKQYIYYIYDDEYSVKNLYDLIHTLSILLPEISAGSIKMKLQNIKQISDEAGFNDKMNITPLEQYSYQCKKAFIEALNDYKDEITERINALQPSEDK